MLRSNVQETEHRLMQGIRSLLNSDFTFSNRKKNETCRMPVTLSCNSGVNNALGKNILHEGITHSFAKVIATFC